MTKTEILDIVKTHLLNNDPTTVLKCVSDLIEGAEMEARALNRKIAKLEKANSDYSWRTNPDRMGGAFTEEEIRSANVWR